MSAYDLTRKSRPVIIREYDPHWPTEFIQLARRIRGLVGATVLRIDHIGSTAVPGLAAKDVLDLQLTVADLERAGEATAPLHAAGFRQGREFVYDEFRTLSPTNPQLRKLYLREPEGERRTHIHIREAGRFNQRYALLFRDYLRASAPVRAEYELLKRRAAHLFPDSIDGYLYLKDPVFHILYEAACLWADAVAWTPDDECL
ncbi:MAG: GrpB family protein [Blastocatellia bacterium]